MMVYAPSRESLEYSLNILLAQREVILSDPSDYLDPSSGLADVTEMIAFMKATLTMMEKQDA